MRVRKAVHVGELPVLRGEVVDRIARREKFIVLGLGALFDIDRESHVWGLPVDLRDPAATDAIERVHAVAMNVKARAQRVMSVLTQRQGVFPV